MSGSPKYSYARLREIELEAERQARRREAEQEAQRRRDEAERQSQNRLQDVRLEADRFARTVVAELDQLPSTPAAAFVPATEVEEIRRCNERAAAQARAAGDETAARAASRALQHLLDRLRRQVTQATRLHERAGEAANDLQGLQRELSEAAALRFLSGAGWAGRLAQARQQLKEATTSAALLAAVTGSTSLRKEVQRALRQVREWQRQANEGAEKVSHLERDLESLLSGEFGAHVERQAELRGLLGELNRDLAGAPPGELAAMCGRIDRARRDLKQTAEAARAAGLAAHLAEEEQALARLRGEVGALDASLCQKFDAQGYSGLAAAMREVERALARRDLSAGRAQLAQARTRLEAHQAQVSKLQQEQEQRRQQAMTAAAEVEGDLTALRQDDRSRWVARDLGAVERRLEQMRDQIRQDRFDEALAAAREALADLRKIAARAGEFAAEADAASACREAVVAAQPGCGREFDAVSATMLARLLDAVEAALKSGDLARARDHLTDVRGRIERHRRAVVEEFARWQVDHDKADAALARASALYAGLRADPVTLRWRGERVTEIGRRLEQAQAALREGRFADVHRAADRLPEEMDRLVGEAQPLELQARLQNRLVDGVCQVMRGMGYDLQAPAAERPEDPQSAIIVQAAHVSGERINVAVEHAGRIEYDVGGALTKQETTSQTGGIRRTVRTCDEAESQLLQLHALLLELGIETDGLHWDGQPPERSGAMQHPAAKAFQVPPRRRANSTPRE